MWRTIRLPVVFWLMAEMTGLGPVMPLAAGAADPFEEINKRFQQRQQEGDEALRDIHEQYRAKRAAMEAQWKQKEQEIEARWQQTKREIERKWDHALQSTSKDWVDYSPTKDARSIVDFENGMVEVTALVPVAQAGASGNDEPSALARTWMPQRGSEAARIFRVALVPDSEPPWEKTMVAVLPAAWIEIAHQIEQLFSREAKPGRPILSNQVMTRAGAPVNQQTVKAFVEQEVLPTAVVADKPVESRDGVNRVMVTAKIKMTPDHVKKRAQHYLDLVPPHAKRHGLDPRLLFALIHTESFFNPRAQSPAPAYGLMQLVPRAAARDAYNFLYKDDKVLDDVYLLDPSNNIELGAAYLHLLRKQLFADLEDGEKKNYLSICAYNWGPTNVRNKVLKQVRVHDLTESQVFALLDQRTPEETRIYLKKVKDRMSLYDDLTES
ncbi:MAG: transglycosylase SLT domain-containing protein [Nitrospirae bacterium]|nr:transglycosylase SLT domain-containing protein [Nitrospirota bacterium]